MKPYCCITTCENDAEFEIRAVRGLDRSPWYRSAGPDFYSDDTHACSEHVGELLSWQPDCEAPKKVFWHVRPIAWIMEVTPA